MMKFHLFMPSMIILIILFSITTALSLGNVLEIADQFEENLLYKQNVYQSISDFVERNPDFYKNDELFFRLGELSAELFVSEPERTLGYFRKVLETNPHYPMKDVVLYNIGYYSTDSIRQQRDQRRYDYIQQMIREDRVEPLLRWDDDYLLTEEILDEAISAYTEILTDFPESRYYTESLYRLSVLYYEIGIDANEPIEYYQKARELLDRVAEMTDNEYQQLALYLRGWSFFSTNRYVDAIKDFTTLLNIIEDDEILQAYFQQDAIDNIAYSLERMDQGKYLSPSSSVIYAEENLPGLVRNPDYIKKIIRRIIDLKIELNAPFHAIDYYNAILVIFPLYINNPNIIDSISTMYQRYSYMIADENRVRELVISQNERLVNEFHCQTEWYKHNADSGISDQIEIIRSAYEFLEPIYFNRFVNEMSEDNFDRYETLIYRFSEFPHFRGERGDIWIQEKSKNIVEGLLEIAQIREQPHYYLKSYEVLRDFNERYPGHSDYIDYELRKFLVIESLYDQIYRDLADEDYVDPLKDLTITKIYLKDLFLEAVAGFVETAANPVLIKEYTDDIVRALFKRSQIYIEDALLSDAENDLKQILVYDISNELRRVVYLNKAQINQTLENYHAAEENYRLAAIYATDEEDRENIKNHYRAQMQAQANSYASKESFNEAASEFLRLADEFRESDIDRYVGFTREAISYFTKGENYRKAIQLLTDLSYYRSEPDAAYILYATAWNIADTLLYDNEFSKYLKEEFIDKYPDSNEAYLTRYEIIEDLSRDSDRRYEAAEMLLALHDEATMGLIDHGDDLSADIYYDALELYHDHPDNEFLIPIMLKFTREYPEDPRTIAIMEIVALKYHDIGRDEEFARLAREIYIRYPESRLYENIARNNIIELYSVITGLFLEEAYDQMFDKINNFEALDNEYRQDNLILDLQEFYLDFEDYKYAANRAIAHRMSINELIGSLDEIEANFINATPGELLRVNHLTRWQENLASGDNRLERIVERSNNYRDRVIRLIQQIREYEQGIELELNTRSLYIIARVFDHTADVIDIQLDRFVEVSTQMRELRDYDEGEYQSIVSFINNNYKEPYLSYLISESAAWYDLMIVNFVFNIGHNDQYTDAAAKRLLDWGLAKEQIMIYSDGDWLAARSNYVDDLESLNWSSVSVMSNKHRLIEISGLDRTPALPIWSPNIEIDMMESHHTEAGSIEPDKKQLFLRRFEIAGSVSEAKIDLASYQETKISINGETINAERKTERDSQNNQYFLYTTRVSSDLFSEGENTLLIQSEGIEVDQAIIFKMNLMVNQN